MSDDGKTFEITRNEYCETEQYHEIDWTIKDFLPYKEGNNYFTSPVFSVPCSRWFFVIYSNGNLEDNSASARWICLYLFSKDEDQWTSPKIATFSFGLRKAGGMVEVINGDISYEFFGSVNNGYREKRFLERSKLSERSSELAPSGDLTITCRLRVNDSCKITPSLMDLSIDFQKLFISKIGCDAKLKVEDVEFPVHQHILASRSSVFEAMFQVEMKEKQTGVVQIVDCHPGAFRDFLLYIYSGKFENSSGDIFELYRIAHKYCVKGLMLLCVYTILCDGISIDNFIDAAILGYQFDEKDIISNSQDFLKENGGSVFRTDKWKSLLRNNPTLANELLINMRVDPENE